MRQVSPLIYDVKHYFRRKFRTRRVHLQMLKPRFTFPGRLETQTDLYNTVTLHDIGPYDKFSYHIPSLIRYLRITWDSLENVKSHTSQFFSSTLYIYLQIPLVYRSLIRHSAHHSNNNSLYPSTNTWSLSILSCADRYAASFMSCRARYLDPRCRRIPATSKAQHMGAKYRSFHLPK